MKIIEILTEDEKKDWATIQGYTPSKMSNRVTNKKDAKTFYVGAFKKELIKILSFIVAWEKMAFNIGYATKEAKQAKKDIVDMLNTMTQITELLHTSNLIMIRKKLNDTALYFGSVMHDFEKNDQKDMANISLKIHHILKRVAAEVEIPGVRKSNVA